MTTRRLLLASLGLGRLEQFVEGAFEEKVLAFVPTAGTPYEDQSFVDRDRQILAKMGFKIREVPLEGKTADDLRAELSDVDVVFVAGGNTFYLMQEMRKSGFDVVLPECIDRGTPYVGASAGAVVVGPDLRPVQTLDDPTAAPDLTSMEGLGLVEFVVLPHYGLEKYLPEYESIIERYKDELEIVPLRNDQAVEVIGTSRESVASAE